MAAVVLVGSALADGSGTLGGRTVYGKQCHERVREPPALPPALPPGAHGVSALLMLNL